VAGVTDGDRPRIEPVVGQRWVAANGQTREVVRLWPASPHTDAAVQLRQANGLMMVASFSAFRQWVSRMRAELA
jgi:hypothetical protein